jgi:hypothetical protein
MTNSTAAPKPKINPEIVVDKTRSKRSFQKGSRTFFPLLTAIGTHFPAKKSLPKSFELLYRRWNQFEIEPKKFPHIDTIQ